MWDDAERAIAATCTGGSMPQSVIIRLISLQGFEAAIGAS